MRVVLDANVLVSGLLSPKARPGKFRCLVGWAVSIMPFAADNSRAPTRAAVPSYPGKVGSGSKPTPAGALSKGSSMVEGGLVLDILTRDPSDNVYLACAVEAEADYLVSGNLGHFEEAGEIFRGVQILAPRQFLGLISSNG